MALGRGVVGWTLGVFVLLVGVISIAQPARASTTPEFFGITSSGGYGANDEGWDTVAASGADVYRGGINWQDIMGGVDCSDPLATPLPITEAGLKVHVDPMFKRAARKDIRILPYLYGNQCTRDVFPFNDPSDPDDDDEYSAWKASVRALVQRYGIKGDFWKEHDNALEGEEVLPEKPVLTWEVWNEPNASVNNAYGPGGTSSPKHYARFLIDTSAEIKAKQEAMLPTGAEWLMNGVSILFGGVTTAGGGAVMPMVEFIDSAYDAPFTSGPNAYTAGDLHDAYDGMSVHPYSNPSSDSLDSGCSGVTFTGALNAKRSECHVVLVRNELDMRSGTFGDDKPIWVTELGFAVHPDWYSATEQADHLRDAFTWLKNNRVAENIKVATWYAMRDDGTGPDWPHSSGLMTRHGSTRGAWNEYVKLTGNPSRQAYPAAAEVSPGYQASSDGKEKLLAYRNASGGLTVLEQHDRDPANSWDVEDTSGWIPVTLAPADGAQVADRTTPSVEFDSATGYAVIVFTDSNNRLQYAERTNDGGPWTVGRIGPSGAANVGTGASPSVVKDSPTGAMMIVYRRTDGKLGLWFGASPSSMLNAALAPDVAPATDPKIVRNPSSGDTVIAYQGLLNKLKYLRYTGSIWEPEATVAGATVQDTVSPGITRDAVGNTVIAYVDASNMVRTVRGPIPGTLTVDAAVPGSPTGSYFSSLTVIRDAGTSNIVVPYRNSTGGYVGYLHRQSGSWSWRTTDMVVESGSNPVVGQNDAGPEPTVLFMSSIAFGGYRKFVTTRAIPGTPWWDPHPLH